MSGVSGRRSAQRSDRSAAFVTGAFIPLVPYLLVSGSAAFTASLVLSLFALALLGVGISRLTRRPPLFSALRQVALGGIAAAVTFAVGQPHRSPDELTSGHPAIAARHAAGLPRSLACSVSTPSLPGQLDRPQRVLARRPLRGASVGAAPIRHHGGPNSRWYARHSDGIAMTKDCGVWKTSVG